MTTTVNQPDTSVSHPRYNDEMGSVLFELYGEFERWRELMTAAPGYTITGDLAHILLMTIEGAMRTGDATPIDIPGRACDAWFYAADLDDEGAETVFQVMQALLACKDHPARAAMDEMIRSSARAVRLAAELR